MNNRLIDGNPCEPNDTDLIAQTQNVPMGEAPAGDGWRILTGNMYGNLWGRVAYRYEIERDAVRGRAAELPYD